MKLTHILKELETKPNFNFAGMQWLDASREDGSRGLFVDLGQYVLDHSKSKFGDKVHLSILPKKKVQVHDQKGELSSKSKDYIKKVVEKGMYQVVLAENLAEMKPKSGGVRDEDDEFNRWQEFYQANYQKVADSGLHSLDDVENAFEEIRERIHNAVKHKMINHPDWTYDWDMEEKIHKAASDRFERKYGLDEWDLKYFYNGLRKYTKQTDFYENLAEMKPKAGGIRIETLDDLLNWANNNNKELIRYLSNKYEIEDETLFTSKWKHNPGANWIYIMGGTEGYITMWLSSKKFEDWGAPHREQFNGVKFWVDISL